MRARASILVFAALAACAAGCLNPNGGSTVAVAARTRPAPSKPLVGLQRDFVDLRFGMFLHFGILTYTGA